MTETKQDSAQRHYDGTGFRVTIDQKQVTLTVYPRVVGSEPVSVEDVNKFFAQQGWPRVDAYTLASVVKMSDGQPHVIVDDLPAVAVDASFSVRVANNRMHAFGLVKPAVWGRPLTMDNLKSKLTEAGISFGVKEDVLAQIVLNQSREREWLVAEGQEPVHGIHARIEYVEQIKKSPRTFAFLPDGRVDFRELDNIINVEPGEVLARRIPPTPGKPGYNVLGEEIAPKPGRELNWPLGKGVEVVDDHIVASIAGQVVLKHNKVHVLPVYDVAGDVDYSVGNIRFLGNVFVRGSVRPGFTVEADGDINILGWVDSANIACSGDLTVSGGIQGQGRGQVSVEGDIYTKFIENCTVTAKGNVVVGEDIMHSRVLAGGSIQVGGRKGLIVGGEIRATDNIICKVLGSSLGTPTSLEVGTNPAIYDQYGQLQGTIAKMEEELARLMQGVRRLQQLQAAAGALPPERQELYRRLLQAQEKRQRELVAKKEQLALLEKAMESIKDAYVQVSDAIFPGVRVNIGKSVYFVRDRKSGGTFSLVSGDVVLQDK